MDTMSDLKRVQLEILGEIKRVCDKNDISFFLVAGTCIGAVRHEGFIPWDDDIDIGMLYEDYQKFISLSDEFNSPYFLQTIKTDANYRLQIARVRDSNTTLIENTEKDRDINHGVFVDVYPLYNTPKKGIMQKRLLFVSQLRRLLLFGEAPEKRGKFIQIGANVLLAFTTPKIRKIFLLSADKILEKQKITGYVSFFYGNHIKVIYPRHWFLPVKLTAFEGKQLPVPCDADNYLKVSYGDYMTLPPVEKRVVHHDYSFIDCAKNYKEYKGIYYCNGGKI